MSLEATGSDLLLLDRNEQEEPRKVASGLHGVINARLIRALANFVEERHSGYILDSSTTYNFRDGLPKRQPDVSYVTLEKMPAPLDDELTFAPELAVEVVSRNDVVYDIESKVQQHQQAGVKLIWVVYPLSRTVHIYRPENGLVPEVAGPEDELDGGLVLAGFRLAVKSLFT